MKIIAVDIGGTHIRHALIDPKDLSILQRLGNFLTPREDPAQLCRVVVDGIEQLRLGSNKDDFLIAISSAGLVCPKEGSVVALSPKALPAFAQRFALREYIAQATHLEVVALNDGQAATYGEYTIAQQQQKDLENFMLVTVSTGTGGGFVLNKQLIQGKKGKAGHIGRALMFNQSRGAIEDFECIEDYTCGRYVANKDENAKASAGVIARMIASKVIELDLDAVSLSGGVTLGIKEYLLNVQRTLLCLPSEYHVALFEAKLGDNAGLVGAAAYARDFLTKRTS
jgi:N-acylmannosamine kinase